MNKEIKPLRELLLYCRKYAFALAAALILGAAGAVFSVIGPDKIADMVNVIEQGIGGAIDLHAVRKIGIFLAALYGFGWAFGYMQNFILITVTQRMTQSLRTEISRKIDRMPLCYFDKLSFGDVLSRITNDADMIGQMLNSSIGTFVSSITLLTGSLVMMFITNVQMTLAAVISSLLGFILLILLLGKSQKYFLEQQNVLGKMDGYIEELFSGQKIVRAYNAERKAEKDFDVINETLYDSAWKSRFLSGLMMPIMSFVGNLGYAVVCVLGAVLVAGGIIRFSVIISFMIYIRLFTQPLAQTAQVLASIQPAIAASSRVFEFLHEAEQEDESGKTKCLSSVQGNVEFEHVRFGYFSDKMVIHDFSLNIEPGQNIAIVGHTGAGKTTIVNLLMRFYEVNGGIIRIDGIPIKEIKREDIRRLFGMVLQDTWIFEGTLRENLVYCNPKVSDEQLDRVCQAVGLTHFIKTLPEGYDTVLNEQASLSAGQRQLVTIARAMLEDAPLLILDEATSSVDTKTEIAVQNAMSVLMEGRTSFIIAHRLSTIRNADLILVMKDGDIVERGKHEELLMKNGVYAELYNSQFEKAVEAV